MTFNPGDRVSINTRGYEGYCGTVIGPASRMMKSLRFATVEVTIDGLDWHIDFRDDELELLEEGVV